MKSEKLREQINDELTSAWQRLGDLRRKLEEKPGFYTEITELQEEFFELSQAFHCLLTVDSPAPKNVAEALDAAYLREMCDSYRLFALLTLAGTLSPDSSNFSSIPGALYTRAGGLVFARNENRLAVLLPGIRGAQELEPIHEGFLEIFDQTKESDEWVIDFSGVTHLPTLLLGVLAGYQENERPRKISIYWLRVDALPRGLVDLAKSRFQCAEIAGHLFTEEYI